MKPKNENLTSRIAGLSPEKRALLEMLLESHGVSPAELPVPRRPSNLDGVPLSFAQQRLWFLDQLEPGNPFYNLISALRIRGRLDIGALEESFNEIRQRHEILRTTFVEIDRQPVQIISPMSRVSLPVISMSAVPQAEREQKAKRFARQEARNPFDLSCGPLLRHMLLRLDDDDHVV